MAAFIPGSDTYLASDSPKAGYRAVFEDDCDTAYFYAIDRAAHERPIQDTLHIYNSPEPGDRDPLSNAEIVWSSDGLKAGLTIDGRLHAVLDFEARKAYCRRNAPPDGGQWTPAGREPWREDLADLLR